MTTTYGGLFLNSSFGFPGMPAAVLPSGGPNYPMATPFVRAQLKATDNVTIIGALYNGDPAPPGPGDPQIRDRNGTAFRLDDHALAFGEVWYSPDPNAKSLVTTYKLGVWYSTSPFADQRFDTAGGLLANPAGSGLARTHSGDWAFYGIVDQMVWQRPEAKDQGIGVFLQVMAGPSDRNLSNLFIEGGMNFLAPFTERPDDVFGIGVAYLGISPAARSFSRDLGFLRSRRCALRQQRDHPGGVLYGADNQLADPAARSSGRVQPQCGHPGEFQPRPALRCGGHRHARDFQAVASAPRFRTTRHGIVIGPVYGAG
jgi:porin